jgi:SAM-dependent methyltransferase
MTEHRPKQVHPFPARMAPELALEALERAPDDAVVLDPMCGSGTVLQHARERGMSAFGYDIDPLAILVTRVTCTQVDAEHVQRAAVRLVDEAQATRAAPLPWIDADATTSAFVDFWFHPTQQAQLRRLAFALHGRTGKVADLLRVALSRTIITKDAGASLARDVSHSRPHRVRETNDYDVYKGFLQAARKIAPLVDTSAAGSVSVARRDARRLPRSLQGRIDLVITSPPYLNAIDYMRGHRMSLVWLGHQIGQLTELRSNSVGAERYPDQAQRSAGVRAPRYRSLSPKQQGMLDRYAIDASAFMGQLAQVLSPRGEAVLVVGDSTLSGTYVRNSLIIQKAAEHHALVLVDKQARPLPTSSRYLPPPASTAGALSKRMRHEVIMRFGRCPTKHRSGQG